MTLTSIRDWLKAAVSTPVIVASVVSAFLASSLVAWAANSNYLGTVFISDATTPTQQLSVTAGGSMKTTGWSSIISGTITRPANTTVYTANTAWANNTAGATVTTFTAVCDRNAQQILIPQIDIASSANPATKLQGILWLFASTPTQLNDNATFTLSSTDYGNLTGSNAGFPFTLTNVQGGSPANSGVSLTGVTYHAACASGATTISFMVQVVNAYTPTSGEVMTIKLHALGAN